jgi:hypothetical protein
MTSFDRPGCGGLETSSYIDPVLKVTKTLYKLKDDRNFFLEVWGKDTVNDKYFGF